MFSVNADSGGNAPQKFEMSVQSPLHQPASGLRCSPRGFHNLRESRDQCAVDKRDCLLDVRESLVAPMAEPGLQALERFPVMDLRQTHERIEKAIPTTYGGSLAFAGRYQAHSLVARHGDSHDWIE